MQSAPKTQEANRQQKKHPTGRSTSLSRNKISYCPVARYLTPGIYFTYSTARFDPFPPSPDAQLLVFGPPKDTTHHMCERCDRLNCGSLLFFFPRRLPRQSTQMSPPETAVHSSEVEPPTAENVSLYGQRRRAKLGRVRPPLSQGSPEDAAEWGAGNILLYLSAMWLSKLHWMVEDGYSKDVPKHSKKKSRCCISRSSKLPTTNFLSKIGSIEPASSEKDFI